jgi:hypothetical protein
VRIEERLADLGLQLPAPAHTPPNLKLPFAWVRVSGSRAFLSGHAALSTEGKPVGPFGKVPSEVTLQEPQESARRAGLAMLGTLKRALGDLDRVTAWLMVYGAVTGKRSGATLGWQWE